MKLIILFYIILLFLSNISSFKILIFYPDFGYSHLVFNGMIGNVLSNAGHNVTIIKINLKQNLSMVVNEPIKLIDMSVDENILKKAKGSKMLESIWEKKNYFIESLLEFYDLVELMYQLCEFMLDNNELTSMIRNEKYDIMISEYINVFAILLGKHYNIDKFLYTSSLTNNELIYDVYGLYYPSSYVPTMFLNVNDKMTTFERWLNFLFFYSEKFIFTNILLPKFEKLYEKKSNKYVSIINLAKKSGGILINTYPFIDKPTPINLKTYFVGGICLGEVKKVPKKWDDILNRRKYNILVSFGTVVNVTNAPFEVKNSIIRTFESLNDITFIWKYEGNLSTLPKNIPENIVIVRWMPQFDLLNDSRIKIFITHCGMNSIIEASYTGKPILCIPFFGDQMRNSGLVYRLGFSEFFDKIKLSNEKEFRDKIIKMIKNNVYQDKANRINKLVKYLPYSPKDIVIKVTEYICHNGNINELNLEGGSLTTIEFFNLDIILILCIILITKVVITLKISKFILNYFFQKKVKVQ
uniref:glucuronosyltransferase n=1 Tax=Strongyloides stercoralis TaxID=6248 RepID=A0A0K0ENX0_STRER